MEKLTVKIGHNKKADALYSTVALVLITAVIAGTIYFNSPIRKIESIRNDSKLL